MKTCLPLLVVLGLALVAALAEGVENGQEVLDFQARDRKGSCLLATNNCNGFGECVEGRWGDWFCRCNVGYRVGGTESSCYPDNTAREYEDELMETRETLGQCNARTSNCNGNGRCVENTRFAGEYICICNSGYTNGVDGSCYPANSAREFMETRETLGQCNARTNNCNGNGNCVENTRYAGEYICICDPGYTNGRDGSCYQYTKKEFALLDLSLRDSENLCNADTNNCNGVGYCVEARYGWSCVCNDWSQYKIGANGSCVPRNPSTRTAELLKRLYSLLEQEAGEFANQE
ncbi:exogastrula-inducing polypeptide-like isoform X1 [Diadema setosum]|uniref:exogastrula-inducing polypeptide-like isoform X1 n=1 Tax=Diadema setosum TaxID=31175 RepID=UPI003B3B9135